VCLGRNLVGARQALEESGEGALDEEVEMEDGCGNVMYIP
jgi:hypothetical protein